MIFSWQQAVWQQLKNLHLNNRLPHALLFTGVVGIGKRQLAEAFAGWVLCQHSLEYDFACGHCQFCQLMKAQSHPDLCLIQPEQESRAIKIDQVRELNEFIQKSSHQGGYRVVVIQPATAMNTYAANALLKTLEEPTANTLIILISDQQTVLPITIVSRCQQFRCVAPSRQEALAWLCSESDQDENFWSPILVATGGAPLLAKTWHQQGVWPLYQNFMRDLAALSKHEADPVHLAVQWKDASLFWVFNMFFQWIIKLISAQQGVSQEDDFMTALLPQDISVVNLLKFADYLQALRIEALGPYNLNQQLLLESLFIRWSQYAAC